LHFIPYTDEEKAAIKAQQNKYDEERKASGLAHEEILTFPFKVSFYLKCFLALNME
jgi:hypothetical protein